jgi:DNA-binding transcriptional LysR family regulator
LTIDHLGLAGIDLNLLVALDALLTERSVTRAAARVGLRQSTMSSSLGRLRALLGDELLTRVPEGMALTPRAMNLVEPVRSALRQFQGIVLREDAFDPKTVERVFTIALTGSLEVSFGPLLLDLLRREAPGIRLSLRTLDYATLLPDIDADQIDMAIGLIKNGQMHHKVRPLCRYGYLCLFNAELLGIEAPVSLEDYLRFPHVLTSVSGTVHGVVDDALAEIGRHRVLAATTPRFVTVPFLVKSAPVMTTMVDDLAVSFAKLLGLTTSPVPVPVKDFAVSMLWHSSYDRDPAHRWMREVVVRISKQTEKVAG